MLLHAGGMIRTAILYDFMTCSFLLSLGALVLGCKSAGWRDNEVSIVVSDDTRICYLSFGLDCRHSRSLSHFLALYTSKIDLFVHHF